MADINTRNPKYTELVGSKDLRETFKDNDWVRGSWFLNGVEMHQFSANAPLSVTTQINAKTGQHSVSAEIDDNGHLVLIDKSGAAIKIREGAPYVQSGPQPTGDTARDVLDHLKAASENQKADEDGNTILEHLGLEPNDEAHDTPRPGFATGRSAEEREKAQQPRDQKPRDHRAA